MAENPDELPGLNLLSFDGGGITGLSSLLTVREIMDRLQAKSGLVKKPNPWEYFDLIAGTGTGAICAVMLGRLRMSVDQAIAAYAHLVFHVFGDKKLVVLGGAGTFKATKLEQGLKAIVEQATGDAEEKMMEEKPSEAKCKVVVYAMSAHNMNAGLPCAFRTYPANANAMPDCPIWKALRASTAHPDLFKSIEIEELGVGQHYVGGGLGCSNPTAQLLREAATLFPDRSVASILSIGTGHARTIQIPQLNRLQRLLPAAALATSQALRVVHRIATDNERVAEEMTTRFSGAQKIYYRLNVDQGMQGIEPSEWERQSEVASHTRAYMQKRETINVMDALVDAVHNRQAITPTIHIDGRVTLSSRPPSMTLSFCPPPTSSFTGRVIEVNMVNRYFGNHNQGQQVFVLYGLGGAGKTQTALKSVEVMAQRFEGVIFIDGSSRENIETALSGFALAKRIGTAYTDTLSWLGSRKTRWLMLFDNVDDPDVRVHEYFPRSSKYSILITTRHQDIVRVSRGKDSHCGLAELHPKEALQLLLEVAGLKENGLGDREVTAAIHLLEEFGYLALAIVQCGACIWRAKCTISQYYNMYLTERRATLEGDDSHPLRLQDYNRSVHTTWALSYVRLGQSSKKLLALSAFLHRDTISEEIFRRASMNAPKYRPEVPPTKQETKVQQEVKAILQLFTNDKGQWSSRLFLSAMSELVCLSLAIFNPSNNMCRLHPLVQQWARALSPDPVTPVQHTAFLLALAIDRERGTKDQEFRRTLVPHVNEIISLCPTPNSNDARQLIEVYSEVGFLDKVEILEHPILEVRSQRLGYEHPGTLVCMANIAGAHLQRGRLKDAETIFTQVLEARTRVLGTNHPDTLKTIACLALTYCQKGCLAAAEETYMAALTAQKQVLGESHFDTLQSMEGLAATYHHHQGRLRKAEALYAEVLAVRRRLLGDDNPDTLWSMANLAAAYFQQGRLAEAEALYEVVLASRRRVLGECHFDTLCSIADLGATYHSQNRLPDAEALKSQVLVFRKRILGDDHPDTLQSMVSLAATYHKQGRLTEAEAAYIDVLAARQRLLGEDHPDSLSCVASLAALYHEQGRLIEAESLHMRALAAQQRTPEADNRLTLLSMANLAAVYHGQGRLSEAESLYLQVLPAQQRVLGDDHPDTLLVMHNLAQTFRVQGRQAEYETLLWAIDSIEHVQ